MNPPHGADRKRRIEVGKKLPAPRHLPFQLVGHGAHLDCQQHQVGLAGEVLGGGFRHLIGGGEVNVTVAQIDRTARQFPGPLRLEPKRRRANLVQKCRHAVLPGSDRIGAAPPLQSGRAGYARISVTSPSCLG